MAANRVTGAVDGWVLEPPSPGVNTVFHFFSLDVETAVPGPVPASCGLILRGRESPAVDNPLREGKVANMIRLFSR